MKYEAACIAIHKPEFFSPEEVYAASEFIMNVRRFPRNAAEAFPAHISSGAHEQNRKQAISARAVAFNMAAKAQA